MKRVLAVLVVALLSMAARAEGGRTFIVSAQDPWGADSLDCARFHTQNSTSLPSHVTAEEERSVDLTGVAMLQVSAGEQGGVSVRGWDGSSARLLVCKCAAADTSTNAKRLLDAVHVNVKNGRIAAEGPGSTASQVWWTHLILQVPKRTKVAIESANGAISIRNVHGGVTARATNGGISLDRVTGPVDAHTENGTISLRLDPKTSTPVEARTEDSGAIICNVRGCVDGSGQWSSDRRQLKLGGGSLASIRLTTTAAPIVIEQVR